MVLTTAKPKLNNIFRTNNFDLLRILAATEVLLHHSYWHLEVPVSILYTYIQYFTGVPMFFVISGFLISASYERNPDLKSYFRNRALRIYPALWCCIILTICTIAIVSKVNFFNKEFVPWFFSNCIGIIYTPHFLSHFGFGSYNGSLWTIPLELQFYILLPVIYFFISAMADNEVKKTRVFILVFLLFTVAAYFILRYATGTPEKETTFEKMLRYTFAPRFFLFLLGVVFQRIKIYESKLVAGKAIYYLIAYFIFQSNVPSTPFFNIIGQLFLGLVTISLAYTLPGLAKKILKGNDISYGVYIYHGLVLGVIVEMNILHNPLYILVVLCIAYLLAYASWNLIEKPFLHKKKTSDHKKVLQHSLVDDRL